MTPDTLPIAVKVLIFVLSWVVVIFYILPLLGKVTGPESGGQYELQVVRPCHCGSVDFTRSRSDGAICNNCGTLYIIGSAKSPPVQVVEKASS